MKPLSSLVALLVVTAPLVVAPPLALGQLPGAVGETPVPSLAPMLKKVTPAVVNVSATKKPSLAPVVVDAVFTPSTAAATTVTSSKPVATAISPATTQRLVQAVQSVDAAVESLYKGKKKSSSR